MTDDEVEQAEELYDIAVDLECEQRAAEEHSVAADSSFVSRASLHAKKANAPVTTAAATSALAPKLAQLTAIMGRGQPSPLPRWRPAIRAASSRLSVRRLACGCG
jgi:hypothetical protein